MRSCMALRVFVHFEVNFPGDRYTFSYISNTRVCCGNHHNTYKKTAARWPLSALLASMKTRHSTHRSKLEENARDSSSKCVRPSAEHVCIRIFHHSLCALYSNVSTYHHCTVKYDFHSVRMRYGSLLLFFSARAASWSAFAHCLRVCVCARCFSFNTYVCAVVYTLFLSSPVCELPFGGSSFNFLF